MQDKRLIAIHLPQFYPFKENDDWWGKGFTEWRNVTQAIPRFIGHYQPHLPADLGFYDLRLHECRQAQIDMAKQYGIYGFCYYHYWFSGKLIMEKPVEMMLADKREDFPFMLCWANANWGRNWEGGHNITLIEQKYSDEDDIAHFEYLLPFFKDPRYIRINGKPVFGVHRSDYIPDFEKSIGIWQRLAAKEGFQLYICRFEAGGFIGEKYQTSSVDAAVEFQPFNMGRFWQMHNLLSRGLERVFKRSVKSAHLSYKSYVKYKCKQAICQNYKLYPSVFPSWDNSPRRLKRPYLAFTGSTPELFKEWFEHVYTQFKPYSEDENLIFINAWNEWAEGCHLEPDLKNGTGFLEAVKSIIDKYSNSL